MKILHTADIHLGSKIESKFPSDISSIRKKELLSSFKRMVDYAKENDISVILLSGDVFDKDKPSLKEKEYFYKTIKSNPQITFFYLNGNHDKEGSYIESDIENLKTFNKEKFTYYQIEDICIGGIEISSSNYKSFYSSLALNKNLFNIVMLHGDATDSFGMDKVKIDNLKNKNIDYLALGHIHKYQAGRIDDRGVYAFPGCLEPRGFDECGEKGFIVLDIEDKLLSYEFIPYSIRSIIERNVDVTKAKDFYDIEKLVKQSVSKIDKKNILRVNLIGELEAGIDFDEADIEISLSSYFFVNVKNKTSLKINIDDYNDDKSLIGEFIRGIYNNPDYSVEDKHKLINMGLRAINGKEVD